MALEREDTCRHFVNGAFFDRCLILYTGSSGSDRMTWEVCVCAPDMPEGQQVSPTLEQIAVVSDQKALELYNAWLASLPNAGSGSSQSGLGGTVVP